ncbi:F-actin-uncapping protein LRRC16A [Nematolebias whitei]|uniref:F-actin-uncapping protein LRRC16A n=1 Tax=Nematolebias whitei TaxID=451745 RepID=UPI001899FBD4|nr:F-actin-uncapping protein LRRC16A [Nematolebias whitei]
MSDEVAEVPKELLESVRDAVGKRVKFSLTKAVKLEIKAEKMENRVLALASHRAYLLTARIPTKVEHNFNYLEIQGISCNKPTQLFIEYERGSFFLKLPSTEEVNEVVAHIGNCLLKICPGLPPSKVMRKLSMEPPDRLTVLQALWDNNKPLEPGPCGGFSQMYRCVCDWLGLPYREEVQWDVDTIYLTQDTRELNLQDFSHLDNKDLVAIIAVLEFNQWFTKLSTKDYKLSADVCDQILRVVSRSIRLEELVLDNAGLKIEFAQKLATALAHNPSSGLISINLSNNPLEDRGVSSLGAQFAKLCKGLKHLNFSKTSLSPKGINSLCQSLSANPLTPSSLVHLDLSGNVLRGDDMQHFYNFLGQHNSLVTLDLSNTDCSLDQVCEALLRGSVKHLAVLSVSKSVFRKGKEVPPSFKQFFSSAESLRSINVSGTKLPQDALKALLLGLACNPSVKDVSLDLSCCELGHCLRSGGSQILESCIAEIPNISSLDLSDNGLDSELSALLVWLAKNRSIKHLSLGKNFNNIKSKNLAPILDGLVHMIQEEESPLTSLSLADSRLKSDLTIVLNALGSNSSLTRLDISGNAMGDMGAKMLAKALHINSKLKTVIWDRNNTSPQGLQDVAAALEKNFTIRFMPIPIIDASQALKASPEKTEDALLKIENYLYRNHETRKYLQEQAYRLQQGIVMTTTQQMMDRICVKVQDHLNSMKNSETDIILEDVQLAENLLKDARNSKTLLPSLYHLGSASREELISSSMGPIQEKLESMAGEVTTVMDQQLQILLESMLLTAESLCPHVMKRNNLRGELMKASSARIVVSKSFATKTLLEQSGVDIINKISEVKLSLASFLSDRIVDEILMSLSTSQHTLADHLVQRGRPSLQQESVNVDVPKETISKQASTETLEAEMLTDLESCLMTPKSKRKSIQSRMLRPVSHAFEMEFDLDKALKDVPVHVEDASTSIQTSPTPSLVTQNSKLDQRLAVGITELPSEEEKKLQHFTKLRPRRNKNNHSSKVAQINGTPSHDGEQNGLMGRVDEGVDEFFSKKVTKMGFRRSSKSSESQDGEKKKSKGGFLNLIKRSSKSDKSVKSDKPEKKQAALTSGGTTSVTLASESNIPKEPPSPKGAVKSPAPEPKSRDASTRSQPADYSSSSDRSDELRTPDSMDEPWDGSDGRGSPQGGKRYPRMQMMGSGFLAEMKAKQEKRAYKSSSPDRPDSNAMAAKLQSTNTEIRSPSGSLIKADTAPSENTSTRGKTKLEPDALLRATSSSSAPAGPVGLQPPAPHGVKPVLVARPSIPQKPKTSSRNTDEGSDVLSAGRAAPKVLPYTLKKAHSGKDKETTNKTTLQDAVQRSSTNSEDQISLKLNKDKCPNHDKATRKKSSDSGKEADKDFILI